MSNWDCLGTELDAWAAAGLKARFWWRDDDSYQHTRRLDRLLRISERNDAPLALAVIPGLLRGNLAQGLERSRVTVLQHGCEHRSHAPAGRKKRELEAGGAIEGRLDRCRNELERIFGDRFAPVLVPPWNRIALPLVPKLATLGFTGLSTFEGRRLGDVSDVTVVNAHIDVMDWKRNRGFAGEPTILGRLVDLLKRRRHRGGAASEPIGLLTHHLEHDEPSWSFLDRLLAATRGRGGVGWYSIRELMSDPAVARSRDRCAG